MKRLHLILVVTVGLLGLLVSCSKKKNDVVYTSVPPIISGTRPTDRAPMCGTYVGHMETGKVYTVGGGCNIVVNAGDTLYMDAGSTLHMSPSSSIVVKGVFISMGTKANPNWITVDGMVKTDDPNLPASSDSAFISTRLWCGINCDTSCRLLVLKWTHIEYTSAVFPSTPPFAGLSGTSHAIFFQTPGGNFIMEDCWMYGSQDEVRIGGGNIAVLRNTIEKLGYTGGDGFNIKHGTVGDLAYNLFIGVATNGSKASDKGLYTATQTNINMYNNTYVNGGYRRATVGRGGSLNYEEGAKGLAYNNLIVNCKFGLRVVGSPAADTNNLQYGYNYSYGDSLAIVDQIYPTTYITKPHSTDIPDPATFLPTPYTLGMAYTATALIGANNPKFVNYPLPAPGIVNIAYVKGYDFHLQSTSPAIGKGYTGFSALKAVPVNPVYGATEITPPGKDMGCYQADGTGNQH